MTRPPCRADTICPLIICQNNTCLGKHIGQDGSARKPVVKTYARNFRLDRSAQIAGQSAMPSFVYILAAQNPDGRTITYVGWTLDLERRLAEHNGAKTSRGAKKGAQKGAKSTRGRA